MTDESQGSGQHNTSRLKRRDMLRAAAVAAPGVLVGSGLSRPRPRPSLGTIASRQDERRLPLEHEFLFQLTPTLEPGLVLANIPLGMRQIAYVTGGEVDGPQIKGEVLPGGGDWLLFRPDGVGVLDVRLTIRLDDGELLYAFYPGYAVFSPEVFAQVLAGEAVDPATYYFRTTPRFETGSETYSWLNSILAVGVGEIGPGAAWASYSVYRVL
jgi:hypothetical protein